MKPAVPCPNPGCTAIFAPETLRGADQLICPQCGMQFKFRAATGRPSSSGSLPAAGTLKPGPGSKGSMPKVRGPGSSGALPATRRPPSAPALPAAGQPAPVPVVEMMPVDTLPAPVEAPPTNLVFHETGDEPLVRTLPRRRKKSGGALATLIKVVVIFLATGVAVWGVFWWINLASDENVALGEVGEVNYRLTMPRGWKPDLDLRLRMKVPSAYRRAGPQSSMAFLSHDYRTRLPTDAELVEEALDKLRNVFKRVDPEVKPRGTARLDDQEALLLEFDATTADDNDVSGLAYLLGHRGYGYWLFFWSGDRENAESEWEKVRAAFRLGSKREGWKVKPREMEILQLPEAAAYLTFAKEVWQPQSADDYEPKPVGVLKGTPPTEGARTGTGNRPREQNSLRSSEARFLIIPAPTGTKTASETAKEYVLQQQTDPARGNYPRTKVEPLKDKAGHEQDHEAELGGLHGRILKLRMINNEERERFVVLGLVSRPAGLLIIWCECDWSQRDFWDQEFTTLLNSLSRLQPSAAKPKPKEADTPEEKQK